MDKQKIIDNWLITYSATGDAQLITGSPNRTEQRFLFSDTTGRFYIAEGYSLKKKSAQLRQNQMLEFLAGNKLHAIYPFCRTRSGEHGVVFHDLFWQIRPYLPAENIPRTALGASEEYGFLWSDFLLKLKSVIADSENPPPMPNQPFYMTDFLGKLQNFAELKMPSILPQLRNFIRFLAPFLKYERQADGMFAHGDFHPGNILMDKNGIKVVIDWEFAGVKFPGYDMALLIGCLAMDHPDNLASPAVVALQNNLYRNNFMPVEAWDFLPQMIAATRLGWLGEWLLLEEKALIEQELELLSILLES